MDKLEKLEMMTKDLIKFYCPEYTFKWTHGKRTAGFCSYRVKTIGISKPIAELNTIEEMLLTVTHEIAHALKPLDGHHREWKNKCIEIGGDGKTCYSSKEKLQPKKWVLYKNGVVTTIKRFRRFRITNYFDRYEWRKEQ
jgi:hypothetical protein